MKKVLVGKYGWGLAHESTMLRVMWHWQHFGQKCDHAFFESWHMQCIPPPSLLLTTLFTLKYEPPSSRSRSQHCFSIATHGLHWVFSSLETMATPFAVICSTALARYHSGRWISSDAFLRQCIWALCENCQTQIEGARDHDHSLGSIEVMLFVGEAW